MYYPTMSIDERELYWYDDATYEIGFYNYYQKTVDLSPWAFIVCLSFCIILALLLPRYLSLYRSLHQSEGTNLKPSADESNIFLKSQKFVASDVNQHDDDTDGENANTANAQNNNNAHLPPIDEEEVSNGDENAENTDESHESPKRKLMRGRVLHSLLHKGLSLGHVIRQTKNDQQIEISAQLNTEGELDHSTDYTNMEDDNTGNNDIHSSKCREPAGDERKPSSTNKSKEVEDRSNEEKHYGELIDREGKDTASCNSSVLSETSNPFQIIKNDLKDFTKSSSPDESLSVASGWEEDFDPISQTTVYFNPETGLRTTEKPVEPISDDKRPWYLFYCSPAFRRKIRKCGRWDDEMEKIVGLALPYTAHIIVVDVLGLLEIGIIGRLLGTTELSAYFATEFAISFATMFFYGILASLKVLVSQAHGANNLKLAGTYVQIGVLTHHLFSLPLILYGWNHFDDIVLRLGLDEGTAESAEQYARFALIYEAIGIYDGALHCILDVAGFETYSAISNGVRAFFSFLTVLAVSKFNTGAELWMVGAIHLIVKVVFFFLNVCVIIRKRWLDGYWREMLGNNPFRQRLPIKTLLKASLRLSSGRVIENCEWNILFVFAAIQGPAEVAIWGLVGELWDFADDIVIAVSDASKVRCAQLLGSGLPEQAKYSSEKSLLMGVVVSIIMSISLCLFQSIIPRWLTNDFTLQRLLGDMIPMICLAVVSLSFGSICWSILCAQGRAHLATAVTGFGSLVVALPLASLSTFCFNFNLQGLIACLIIGYATSGFFNSILMLTSNWTKISKKVRKRTTRIEKFETNKIPVITEI